MWPVLEPYLKLGSGKAQPLEGLGRRLLVAHAICATACIPRR
jgi:hypothetical protein